MTQKYKRKFLVPGDTIKDCWDFRKKCDKKYGDRKPCHVKNGPANLTGRGVFYRRDESKCPLPINKPTNYIVSETVDGEWQCSCPVWKFRRKQCHHIEKAKANPDKYEIAKEFTGKLTDTLTKVFENFARD